MTDATHGAPITCEHLFEALEYLEDWEDRYRFILDLGRKLPVMPEEAKNESNFVQGCQSRVWVQLLEAEGAGSPVELQADSDAFIVKGLAAMVVVILAGRSAAEIVAHDLECDFARLGLHEHLSPTRSNGLHGMVEQVKSRAAAMVACA